MANTMNSLGWLMKNLVRNLSSVGFALFTTLAHAGLIMDQKYNGSPKNVLEMNGDELQEPKYIQFKKTWDENILKAIAEDNDGITLSSTPSSRERGHIVWNGKHYYGWAVTYLSAAQDREISASTIEKRKDKTLPGGGICALYVFDQDLNKLASLKINLPENNHGTWCNGTYGFGGAGKDIDGALVTISYYLTGEKPVQKTADIGKGWRHMTVLIRFEEKEGRLMLRQDDSCLGNPNKYDTIPDARKALSRCAVGDLKNHVK